MRNLRFIILKKLYSIFLNSLSIFYPEKSAKLAFKLFKTPHNKILETHHIEYLNQAKVKEYSVGSYIIPLYRWEHSGKKILLLHGWESNAYRWKSFIQRFREIRLDCYAIDAPAHGQSSGTTCTPLDYAKAIDAVVEEFDIDYILAHSFGGYSAIYYLSQYRSSNNLELIILKAPSANIEKFTRRFFKLLNLNKKIQKAYIEIFEMTYGRAIKDFNAEQMAEKIDLPCLIIHDENDDVLDIKDTERIAKHWKSSKFIRTTGRGHRMNKSETINQITDYLLALIEA